jgi:hypothetical protein
MASTEYNRRARARAAMSHGLTPAAPAFAGRDKASAQAWASPGLTSQPVSPGRTVSRAAPWSDAMHRLAHHLRLDGRAAEGFGLQRRGDGEVGQQIGGRHVVAVADQPDASCRPAAAIWSSSSAR